MKKDVVFSVTIILLMFSLMLTACTDPLSVDGPTGSLTITTGGGNGRTAIPWAPETRIEDLEHTIKLFNGPGPSQMLSGIKANQTVNFTVLIGRWDISIEAYLDGVLMAVGSTTVDVKPGPNGVVSILMKRPSGDDDPVDGFIPVTDIINGPTGKVVGLPLQLTGDVMPNDATNQTIVWSVVSAGTTGASISESTLYTTAEGTAVVRAAIIDGLGAGLSYTKDFSIDVVTTITPVTNITIGSAPAYAGTYTLLGTVAPNNATYQSIDWSVVNAGTTGATVAGSTLYTTGAGTVTVKATIANGKNVGIDYTQNFTINVNWGVTITIPTGGDLWVNATLTASSGISSPAWQWKRNGIDITGATSSTYIITEDDMEKTLTVTVSYSGNFATSAPQTVLNKIGIYNEAQLTAIGVDLANLVKNYILVNPITLTSGTNWTPIGGTAIADAYTGTFNGNGKTITGLTINSSSNGAFGMFAHIGVGGTVENLGLINCNITTLSANAGSRGGIVGTNYGTVRNCYVTGTIDGWAYVGGIAAANGYASNRGLIQNCYSTAIVTARGNGDGNAAGGIAGSLIQNQSTIENCYFTGTVNGPNATAGSDTTTTLYRSYAGGIVGRIDSGIVQNCYSTGNIIAGSTLYACNLSYAGGIAGHGGTGGSGTIQNCYATALVKNESTNLSFTDPSSVTTSSGSGGIVGGGNPVVRNCVALNVNIIAATGYAGRVKGYHTTGTLTNNYGWDTMNFNDATGTSWTDDLVGKDGAAYTSAMTTSGLGWWDVATNWYTTSPASKWDFDNVWQWNGTNAPTLRNMPGDAQNPSWP